MASNYTAKIIKTGTSNGIVLPQPLMRNLNLRTGQELDLIVDIDEIHIGLGWKHLVQRWERLLRISNYDMSSILMHPKGLEPTVNYVLSEIIMFIIEIYFRAYGPDYLYTQFYFEFLRSARDHNEDLPPPDEIYDLVPQRLKGICMNFFESNKFYDLWTQIGLTQYNYGLAHSKRETKHR
jgi:hypothetical protein